MNNYLSLALFFFIFSSCSSLQYPIKVKKNKEDQVSLQAAIDLAFASYIKGCLDQQKTQSTEQISFEICREKSKDYVKNNVLFILEYGENDDPPSP